MFSRKLTWRKSALLLLIPAAGLLADLPEWISTIEVRSRLEEIFYTTVAVGSGNISWRKPPRETRPALAQQIAQTPADAQLYYLRAREAEAQLDFAAAEADWAKYSQAAPNPAQAWIDKADFHQRRAEPEKELAALLEAAKLPSTQWDRYRPAASQFSWLALQRAMQVVQDHLLPESRALAVLQAWETRYAAEPEPYRRAAQWLVEHKRFGEVEALIGRYAKAFPADAEWPLAQRAAMERVRGSDAAAVALYDRSFQVNWPPSLLTAYFSLLDTTGARRAFVARARQQLASDPASLDAAARLFHHYRLSGDVPNAQRVLHDLEKARGVRWTPAERVVLAGLFATVQNLEQASRQYYAAYASGDAAAGEQALGALIDLLLQHADQPFRLGSGELSFYRDIATLDRAPGFWNGILSLLLNGQSPAAELAQQEREATPYFHRAAAAELLTVFDNKFPQSAKRASLHAGVIAAVSIHNEPTHVVRMGRQFLAGFANVPERTVVALLTVDAHARLNQSTEEFAIYDALLEELAARADRVPIGEPPAQAGVVARFPEYPRVLDRYIARLVAMKRQSQALALYRREIDRNPNDPGLYERLAAFLLQNKMGGEIEGVYRRAIQQFPDRSWSHKLARYFLRSKMNAKYDLLTKEVAGAFSGSELEQYLNVTATQGSLDPVLYRQVNLYALQRFPHHVPFVRNLLAAYRTKATADPAEWERLLRSHWIYDAGLRAMFFEHLSRTGRLDTELAAARAQVRGNAAAALWVGEAEAWKGHFEESAPLLRGVLADYPADVQLAGRTAAMYRSLGRTEAVEIEETLAKAYPADSAILTRLGEIQADQERFDRASAYWNRIPTLGPGRADRYLEAATLEWDYYRFGNALARLEDGRKKLNNGLLYAYEAGAIRENQGDLAGAANEYVRGALAGGPGSAAHRRLLRLVARAAWQQPLANAIRAAGDGTNVLALRVALLESQSRRADLESLLLSAVAGANAETLAEIRQHGLRSGLVSVERRALERQLSIADYPAAKMEALAARMRFEEAQGNLAGARQAADTLLRENPKSMGAIRTAVNFQARTGAMPKAADVLLAAAGGAYPALQRQFRLEALRKLTEAGEYARVHAEAAKLLAADPIDEQVLALRAGAYARAKDDAALGALYGDAVTALQKAALPAVEKAARMARFRRDWIPALVRTKDFPAAADQYIELLKQFPEDLALLREAALFSSANGQRARITGYFAKAETDSPKDARWPIVRARLENEFGDYNAAVEAWARAVALRPERTDLLASRTQLEERLLRLDAAAAGYRKLYEISFQNPAWLAEGARVLARQGKFDQSVQWLRQAYIDNRPANPGNHFNVAERLLEWGALDQARTELQNAWSLSTENADWQRGATLLARVATRQRQFEQIPALTAAKKVDVQAWLRSSATEAGFYFTPEEKRRYGVWLTGLRTGAELTASVADAATAAGLADVAARVYAQSLTAEPGHDEASNWLAQLTRLQQERLAYAELAQQLEAYYRVHPNNDQKQELRQRVLSAYQQAGDDAGELRMTGPDSRSQRYFDLLTRKTPLTLAPQQQNAAAFLDALANYGLAANKPAVAAQALGGRRSPLWQNSYRALTGLYFGDTTPATRKAFADALGPERIGEKLALAGNREIVLAGDLWFYYAGRYGAWLDLSKDSASAHYLVSGVERRYADPGAYLRLGEESSGAAAESAYRTALLLDAHQPLALLRLARLAGDRGAKADLYRKAFDELRWYQANRPVPEWFWEESKQSMIDAARAGLEAEVHDSVDALVRSYVGRNGDYRTRELLQGIVELSGGADRAVQWLGQIARAAANPSAFLGSFAGESWLPPAALEPLSKLEFELAEESFVRAVGEERELVRSRVEGARIRYATVLLEHGKPAEARGILAALTTNREMTGGADVATLRLRLAALDGTLAAVLKELPADGMFLRNQAAALRSAGLQDASRVVLRAAYQLELQSGDSDSAKLGLAELLLEEGNTAEALPLLGNLAMQTAVPFSQHSNIATLLLRFKNTEEAQRYLETLTQAEPWNGSTARLLAQSKADDVKLAALAQSPAVPYGERAGAAEWLGANRPGARQLNASELNYLAAGTRAEAAAEQPLWAHARQAAAQTSKDPAAKARLYRGLIAIAPDHPSARPTLLRVLAQSNRWREMALLFNDQAWRMGAEGRALLADALTRTGQLPQALALYEQLSSDPSDSRRSRWRQARDIVQRQMALDRTNEQRRPVIVETLEQDRIVKPRLTATSGGVR